MAVGIAAGDQDMSITAQGDGQDEASGVACAKNGERSGHPEQFPG